MQALSRVSPILGTDHASRIDRANRNPGYRHQLHFPARNFDCIHQFKQRDNRAELVSSERAAALEHDSDFDLVPCNLSHDSLAYSLPITSPRKP